MTVFGRELHIHVEEPSMEAFLEGALPKILNANIPRKIIDHGSKKHLIRELPNRLQGYAKYPVDYRPKSLVLLDRDNDDCLALKAVLEEYCRDASLATKSSPSADGTFDVVNRIVIEELEAWYFGAIPALTLAYPGVPANLSAQHNFRDPDGVAGGTHETLLRVFQHCGHYKGLKHLPKIETARRVSALLDPGSNRSRSFQQFLAGLNSLVSQI